MVDRQFESWGEEVDDVVGQSDRLRLTGGQTNRQRGTYFWLASIPTGKSNCFLAICDRRQW
jgi:hypothetical protein